MPFDEKMFRRAIELSNEYFMAIHQSHLLWQKRDKTNKARREGRTCAKHAQEWNETYRMRKHALRKAAQLRMKAFGKCRTTLDYLSSMFECHRGRSGFTGAEAHKYIVTPEQADAVVKAFGAIEHYFDTKEITHV